MSAPLIEFYPDGAGEWRWRAVADNERVIGDSSEGYVEKRDCEAGLAMLAVALRVPSCVVVEIGADGGRSVGDLHSLMVQVARRQA